MQMIIRNELMDEIRNDLKKCKIIYMEAPCGWGKSVLLHQLQEKYGKEKCTFIYSSEIMETGYRTDSSKIQQQLEVY